MVTDEDIEEGWRYMKERGFKMTPGIEAAINRYLDSVNYAPTPSVLQEATGEATAPVSEAPSSSGGRFPGRRRSQQPGRRGQPGTPTAMPVPATTAPPPRASA